MNSVVRTHDHFYAFEDPKAPPKDSFIAVGDLIEKYTESVSGSLEIVDFGCATGAFLNYLQIRFPEHNLTGLEYLEPLISKGRLDFPSLHLRQASLLDQTSLVPGSVDIITVLGVLSIFDTLDTIIENLACWIKPGGKLLIHGMFNPYDIDVFVKYKKSRDFLSGELEAGWNIISQATFTRILLDNNCKGIKYHKFEISADLAPNPADPARSWTELLSNGKKQIVNGLCIKQPQFIAEADF